MITKLFATIITLIALSTISEARPLQPYLCPGDVYIEITTNKDANPHRISVAFPLLPATASTLALPRLVISDGKVSLGGKACHYLDEEATDRVWKRFGYNPE